MIDPEFIKYLNLVQSSPSFVVRIEKKTGVATVSNPTVIPDKSGEYLLHGTTTLKGGRKVESIFHIDTDTDGTLRAIYWKVAKSWINSQEANAASVLALDPSEIFPFDWAFSIPLEHDIFHPAAK